MKHIKVLICLALCLAVAGVCGCATIPAPKTALTGETFTQQMQALGYTVTDTTETAQSQPGIVQVLTAAKGGVSFQFYVMESPADATAFGAPYVALFKEMGDADGIETTGPNFHIFFGVSTLNINVGVSPESLSYFNYVACVDNTVLLVRTSAGYRAQVEQTAQAIGY